MISLKLLPPNAGGAGAPGGIGISRFPNLRWVASIYAGFGDSATIFSSRRRAVIQPPTARIVFLRSLVFIIVVMMFAERGPTKTRHDFVEKQIKKDNSTYSSTR